jgi:hypothetical protein
MWQPRTRRPRGSVRQPWTGLRSSGATPGLGKDFADVGYGFLEGRDSAGLLDRSRPGIVCGQSFRIVPAKLVQHLAKIFGPSLQTLLGVIGISNAKGLRSTWHELAQAFRAHSRRCSWIPVAFGAHERSKDFRIHTVAGCGCIGHCAKRAKRALIWRHVKLTRAYRKYACQRRLKRS